MAGVNTNYNQNYIGTEQITISFKTILFFVFIPIHQEGHVLFQVVHAGDVREADACGVHHLERAVAVLKQLEDSEDHGPEEDHIEDNVQNAVEGEVRVVFNRCSA